MFDNTNQYILRSEIVDGITHYCVSFVDGQAIPRETEVSRSVYLEFHHFKRCERNLRRSDERHIEQSSLTDETLYMRAISMAAGVEEIVLNNMQSKRIQEAVASLPGIQQRRLILYYVFGLTFEQIAEMEGCSKVSIFRSVGRAEVKIKKKINKFKT